MNLIPDLVGRSCPHPSKRAVMIDDKRQKGQWTARAALRLIGAMILVIVGLMALLGGFVLDLAASPTLFLIYWAVFVLLLLIVVLIAMFDVVATIGKFKKEHAQLRDLFEQESGKESDNEQQGKP